MKRAITAASLGLVLTIWGAGCSSAAPDEGEAQSGAQTANPNEIARLTEVKGVVAIKRQGQGWRRQGETTGASIPIYSGDLMRAERGAKGVIVCNYNSTAWVVPDDGVPWGPATTCSPSAPRR
jgi:hypothetical protein